MSRAKRTKSNSKVSQASKASLGRRQFIKALGVTAAAVTSIGGFSTLARAQQSPCPPVPAIPPYTLSPGATEVFLVNGRETIDIHGIGKDTIDLSGFFIVRRGDPQPLPNVPLSWGNAVIPAEFRDLELFGVSKVFGTVRVGLDRAFVSQGQVGPALKGTQAAACAVSVHPSIELPEQKLTLTASKDGVILASNVIMVPPIGDVARSENSVPLIDELGHEVGTLISADLEIGQVLARIPLNRTVG